MRVLHVSPEIAPIAKVGGLGDVALELPEALVDSGIDARVIVPFSKLAKDNVSSFDIPIDYIGEVCVPFEWGCYKLPIYQTQLYDKVNVYLVGGGIIENSHVYQDPNTESYLKVFPLFCVSVMEILHSGILGWVPDIVHVHDWAMCFVPVYRFYHKFYKKIKTPPVVLSIHNIAHRGLYPPSVLEVWHIESSAYDISCLEFWGNVCMLKGGIVCSERIITVSKKYAQEIQTLEFGNGLDGVLREYSFKLRGILNGLDCRRWDPSTDEHIPANYSVDDISGKDTCKKTLQQELNLDVSLDKPLLAMVSRLVWQKGLDILIPVIPDLVEKLGVELVIVGVGEKRYEEGIKSLADRYKNVYYFHGFDEAFARKVYAASDIFLMPSFYEPCGLGQLIAMRYGSIPLVRGVGGLYDTVKDVDDGGWGFVFYEHTESALYSTCERAVSLFNSKREWWKENLVIKVMSMDLSWSNRVKEYILVYDDLLNMMGV